jgi:small subunit ribosomal protein S9
MIDDEQGKENETSEQSQDEPQPTEETPAEGSDAPAASEETAEGPTAEQDTSEGSGAEEDSAAEGSGEEEQAADAPEAEKRKEKPAKKDEKKKDVIPGADLEPIAVEPEERPLSAEEQARKEAEEEERARKEAALVGDGAEEPSASSRAPAEMDSGARYLATGKRKRSVARVTVLAGSGKIEVNKRPLEEFFPRPLHQTIARQPLATTGYETNVDVRVRVHGGGVSGQAGAVRHGIARALIEIDPALRGELKRRGFLTRDARVKERRKAGLKKARKRPQFSKR